jgi:tetratricopeptide (TPR) repeat protein
VRLVSSYEKSAEAIQVILSDAERLSQGDLTSVLRPFVLMALGPPPGSHFGGNEPISLDAAPIRTLFEKKQAEICAEVDELLRDSNPNKIGSAVEIILATDSDKLLLKHARSIVASLMRRRILLPSERRDSSVLYYLREASSKCLRRFPDETDKIIQAFLADNDDTGRKEALSTYNSVLRQPRRRNVQIGIAQRIAFKRLLWAAVERPENSMEDAGQFFRHSSDELAQLAVEHFDDLIGAAATLSEKYDQVDAKHSLVLSENMLDHLDRKNKRTAIDSLQSALIKWAAIGAKSKGHEGIEQFLELYRKLPDAQVQMRGNMIAHVSKLLTGVESLKVVLSDWYRALMDESALVRASAVEAWEHVPYDLVENFPDLFFEAFSVLLKDPYVIVHRSAVRSLQYRSFPDDKLSLIKPGLWNLIFYYSQASKQEDFVVDCIDTYASLCLSTEERKGKIGLLLSGILLRLDGNALYHAVHRLGYGFKEVPGFVKVALKSIQDVYTRSISIDDCASAILRAPHHELQNCVDDIRKAFEALKPFRPEGFVEALVYATALTKAGNHEVANTCFKKLVASIPTDDRNKHWRIEAAWVATAAEIEGAIEIGGDLLELIKEWSNLLNELEKENEERAKLRDFPPSFFFED